MLASNFSLEKWSETGGIQAVGRTGFLGVTKSAMAVERASNLSWLKSIFRTSATGLRRVTEDNTKTENPNVRLKCVDSDDVLYTLVALNEFAFHKSCKFGEFRKKKNQSTTSAEQAHANVRRFFSNFTGYKLYNYSFFLLALRLDESGLDTKVRHCFSSKTTNSSTEITIVTVLLNKQLVMFDSRNFWDPVSAIRHPCVYRKHQIVVIPLIGTLAV